MCGGVHTGYDGVQAGEGGLRISSKRFFELSQGELALRDCFHIETGYRRIITPTEMRSGHRLSPPLSLGLGPGLDTVVPDTVDPEVTTSTESRKQ